MIIVGEQLEMANGMENTAPVLCHLMKATSSPVISRTVFSKAARSSCIDQIALRRLSAGWVCCA